MSEEGGCPASFKRAQPELRSVASDARRLIGYEREK